MAHTSNTISVENGWDDLEIAPVGWTRKKWVNVWNTYCDGLDEQTKHWFYRDPTGNIQGPCQNTEMRQWYEQGYFWPDLPISRNKHGPYYLIKDVFFTTHDNTVESNKVQYQTTAAQTIQRYMRGYLAMLFVAEKRREQLELNWEEQNLDSLLPSPRAVNCGLWR